MSNTLYKIRGRESLNDFIFMNLFFIIKNNSFGTKIICICILIGKIQRKFNQILQLKSNFVPCVLNYLFLEKILFLNFEIKCKTIS